MKTRCYNKNHINYHNYGGRGITVCAEWIHDFVAFQDWALSHGYRDDLSIDRNGLFIYPEFYIPELGYRADLAIVQMDLSTEGRLSDRVSDIAAIVELKFESGMAQGTLDVIKTDLQKMKQYAKQLNENCQYYFGIIYEAECGWLNWLDRRSTEHWADGHMTELNADTWTA